MPAGTIKRASYLEGSSILHRCDARVKLAFLLTFLLTAAFLPIGAWGAYALMGGLLLVALLASELPLMSLFKRSLILEIPILLVLLPQLLLKKGDYVTWMIFDGLRLSFSLSGLVRVASLLVRSYLSLGFAVLITAVTRFEDLLAAMSAWGLPGMLEAILSLMWRYLFILIEEAESMTQARASRSTATAAVPSGGPLFWQARVTGGMAGALLLRTLERSEHIYQAMQARGYDGRLRLEGVQSRLNGRQKIIVALALLLGILIVLLANGWIL